MLGLDILNVYSRINQRSIIIELIFNKIPLN